MQYLKLFLIFGPDPQKTTKITDETDNQNARNKVKVIKKYLNTQRRSSNPLSESQIDETLLSLFCLPEIKWSAERLEPKFHTFIVTREDGERLYGAGLTVYERPSLFLPQKSRNNINNDYKTIGQKFGANYKISEKYPPLTASDGHEAETKCEKSNDDAEHEGNNRELSDETVEEFASFCYCIITSTPFICATRALLNLVWEENCDDTLIRCIMHIRLPNPRRCLRISLPPRSQKLALNNKLNKIASWKSKHIDRSDSQLLQMQMIRSSHARRDDIYLYRGLVDLPLFDYPLRELFTILPVDDFLFAFACILMELRTLIIGTDNYQLTMIGEALTSLLLPLKWCHVYVPILPPIFGANYLDAPTPYVMGINTELTQLPAQLNYVQCCIYCDEGRVECNANSLTLPPFFDDLREEIVQIFAKYNLKYERNSKNFSRLRPSSTEKNPNSISENDLTGEGIDPEDQTQIVHDQNKKISLDTGRRHSSSALLLNKSLNALRHIPVSAVVASANSHGKSQYTRQFTYLDDLKFNQALRIAFMKSIRRNILNNYERFIVSSYHNVSSSSSPNEANNIVHQFDTVSYLCDQPDFMATFLKSFLDTQMFASFIDDSAKRIEKYRNSSQSSLRIYDIDPDEFPKQFDDKHLEDAFKSADRIRLTDLVTFDKNNESQSHLEVKSVPASPMKLRRRPMPTLSIISQHQQHKSLDVNLAVSNRQLMLPSPLSHRSPAYMSLLDTQPESQSHKKDAIDNAEFSPPLLQPPPTPRSSQQARLVERMLKEVKSLTKSIIVNEMKFNSNVETTTNNRANNNDVKSTISSQTTTQLVGSLCDLIERIWSHGAFYVEPNSTTPTAANNSTCPLWTHLFAFATLKYFDYQKQLKNSSSNNNSNNDAFTDVSNNFDILNLSSFTNGRNDLNKLIWNYVSDGTMARDSGGTNNNHHRQGRGAGVEFASDSELITSTNTLLRDLYTIQSLEDVKAEVGKSRAFIRLALERKCLSQHLRALLSDQTLLESLYKPYAFLRCEEEREQLLVHLLTLSTVDLSCFTTKFSTNSNMRKHVLPPIKNRDSHNNHDTSNPTIIQKLKSWYTVLKKK